MYSMSNRNSEEHKKPQKRLEYIGKNVRVSRTGGVAVTKTFKKEGVGVTLNTNFRAWLVAWLRNKGSK
jgi:ABC-type sulfate transport system substrate-binding protein